MFMRDTISKVSFTAPVPNNDHPPHDFLFILLLASIAVLKSALTSSLNSDLFYSSKAAFS